MKTYLARIEDGVARVSIVDLFNESGNRYDDSGDRAGSGAPSKTDAIEDGEYGIVPLRFLNDVYQSDFDVALREASMDYRLSSSAVVLFSDDDRGHHWPGRISAMRDIKMVYAPNKGLGWAKTFGDNPTVRAILKRLDETGGILKTPILSIIERRDELERTVDAYKQERQGLLDEGERLRKRVRELEDRVVDLSGETPSELKSRYEYLREDYARALADLEDAQKATNDLRAELAEKKRVYDNLWNAREICLRRETEERNLKLAAEEQVRQLSLELNDAKFEASKLRDELAEREANSDAVRQLAGVGALAVRKRRIEKSLDQADWDLRDVVNEAEYQDALERYEQAQADNKTPF